jgi:hypothetical protein
MPTIADLREREAGRLKRASQLLDEALRGVDAAEKLLNLRREELSSLEDVVTERLNALALVEKMLTEVKQESETAPLRDLMQEDAMRAALLNADRVMNSSDLADAMKAGGYIFTSNNPANAVVVAANKNSKGYFEIGKEGNRSLIGLVEWTARDSPAVHENAEPEAA